MTIAVYAGLTALVVLAGWRTAGFAGRPDFEPDVPRYHRTGLEIEGASLLWRTDAGSLVIKADLVRPKIPNLADFRSGAGGQVILFGAQARCEGPGPGYTVSARRAIMNEKRIEFQKPVTFARNAGNVRTYDRVVIDLVTGQTSTGRTRDKKR